MRFGRLLSFFGVAALVVMMSAAPASAFTTNSASSWPGIGYDTSGPQFIITISSSGVASIAAGPGSSQGAYDGVEDAYIGVVNNYGAALLSVQISGSNIFGFDGDGIQLYGQYANGSPPSGYIAALNAAGGGNPVNAASFSGGSNIPNAQSSSGYGGPNVTFTITNSGSGTVNFGSGGVDANGGTTYFSLENPAGVQNATLGTITTTPEPGSLVLAGMGLVGFVGYGWRRRNLALKK
jgi:hypothetical protein